MFLEIVLLGFILLLVKLKFMKTKRELLLEKIPGPKNYPLIGSILEFDYPKTEVTDTFKQLSFKYGPVTLVRLGFDCLVLIRDPQDAEMVAGNLKVIDKAPVYWPLYPWLNQGLLTSGGEFWRRHRKIITPAFHFKILEGFVPTFNKNANILVKQMMDMLEKDVDIMPLVSLCALDIISESAMGIEVNAQQEESEYVKSVNELVSIIANRNFNLAQRSFLFPLLPSGRRHDKLIKYLHSVTKNVINERKALINKTSSNQSSTDNELGIKSKKAFLDLLLDFNREGAGLTDQEIREEVDTFMFEGYDTTSSTISFCLHCLSQNLQIQEKVFEELNEIFGDSDREPTYQDLSEMKYLEKVIKETLRMYPTVPFFGRNSDFDLELKSGYTIPANTSILVILDAMNHDPNIHPEPLKFDPDRFNNKGSHPFSFLPFAAGPRNCIGQKYAFLEMKTVISSILRKFKLLPSEIPLKICFSIVLKSSTGIHLRLENR